MADNQPEGCHCPSAARHWATHYWNALAPRPGASHPVNSICLAMETFSADVRRMARKHDPGKLRPRVRERMGFLALFIVAADLRTPAGTDIVGIFRRMIDEVHDDIGEQKREVAGNN